MSAQRSDRILVTGGAGFIGSALVRHLLAAGYTVCNVDALTYAGHRATLEDVSRHPEHHFHQVDIGDRRRMAALLREYRPGAIVNLAAETHVDRSIDDAEAFLQTNVLATGRLLDTACDYWRELPEGQRDGFRFLHVSTDEVFGSLDDTGMFTEATPYAPRSPYAASKAASDHLVRAWGHTYGLPVLITNCSNNYGPYQFPEKLIPLMILNAVNGRPLPVYGEGRNVRDWLYVEDHVQAIATVVEKGEVGRTYNIGGDAQKTNIEVVTRICHLLDEYCPRSDGASHACLIEYVTDRPGHDYRYAIDSSRIRAELGWQPQHNFDAGLEKTVRWYLDNTAWCEAVSAGGYNRQRLGLGGQSR